MTYEQKKVLIGKRILELGKQIGLNNPNAIAKEVKMEYRIISKIIKGKGNPTLATLLKIAEALDVDINELFRPVKKPLSGGKTPKTSKKTTKEKRKA